MLPLRLPYPFAPEAAASRVTPTLSAATATSITSTSVVPRVTFDAGSFPAGTLYAIVYPDGSANPTGPQIAAGVYGFPAEAPADWAGDTTAPLTGGVFTWPSAATGLDENTSYKLAFVWFDGTTYSNVAVSAAFDTLPVFSAAWARFSNQILGGCHVS